MASITIKSLSRADAISLLEKLQETHALGYAIQGKKKCRWVNTTTVNAEVTPSTSEDGTENYDKNTFKISSSYWQESTLREFIGQ